MEINNIKTPEDIFLWMDENMQYGWLDSEGSRHVGEMKNFRKQYRTMSVQETLEHKIGTCIEQAEVMHYLLDKINIKNKMFCCRIYEPDDYGNLEEEEHMHCFVLFWRDGKFIILNILILKKREYMNMIRKRRQFGRSWTIISNCGEG